MRKIAVSISKGGAGKTTSAVNLAHALSLSGARVLVVDTDTQGQAAVLLGVSPQYDLEGLVSGAVKPEEAAGQARPGLDLLAGGRSLGALKREIGRRDFGAEETLSEVLAPYEGRYDFVLLDTSPGWDALNVNVLFYADEVLCPVSLAPLSIQSLQDFEKSLTAIRKYRERLALKYLLPTFLDRRLKQSLEVLEQLSQSYADVLCEPIRISSKLSEAPAWGQTIFEYAPDSTGAEDYKTLAERVKRG